VTGSSSYSPSPSGSISPDGACGGTTGYVCPSSLCCSPWGYCGSSSDHCGSGCQTAFGACSLTASGSASSSGKISTDGSCGGTNGYICGSAMCCSQFGYCGIGSQFCGTGCQAAFGAACS
jgi:Chitin recognition protein